MKHVVLVALRKITADKLADLALKMAEAHPVTFERLLLEATGMEKKTTYVVPVTLEKVSFTDDELRSLGSHGLNGKIACIKELRNTKGLGLKEAKDLCELIFPQYVVNRW